MVTRAQFKDDGELAVIHDPTGQRYHTHPYERPEDVSELLVRGADNERDPSGNVYDTGDIADVAMALLREKVAARSRA